jgi:prephenate dehydratase
MRIVYHGGAGSYGHVAARTLYPNARLITATDLRAAVQAMIGGGADLAIIPVDNSIIGSITDGAMLTARPDVVVVEQIDLPIRHCLLALRGAALAQIRTVESHPAALAQCARYIGAHGFALRRALSTAAASKTIAADRNFSCAAIAGEEAAEHYGLAVLERNVADRADNSTRFVALARAIGSS